MDIAKEHWKYLGFSWHTRFFVFTVLPLGLASAFTKLVRPLVKYWRGHGLRIIVYLDDGLCATKGETNALEASALVQSTLNRAGFVTHATKSIWKPTQRLQWLGFVVDLSKGQIDVPDKLAAVKVKLQKSYQLRLVSAKHLTGFSLGPFSVVLPHATLAYSLVRVECRSVRATGHPLRVPYVPVYTAHAY